MQVFYEAGFKDVAAEKTEKSTYVYQSRTGSLDHVLALDTSGSQSQATSAEADLPTSAFDAITGADVWNINSVESLALEYSRFNYNISDLYAPDQFRASDHDPVVVGLFDDDSDGGDDEGAEDAGGSDDADGAEADAGVDGAEGSADSAGSDDADGAEADADGGDSDGGNAGSGSSGSGNAGSSSSDGSSASSDGSSDSEAGGDLPRTGTDPTIMMAIAAGLIAIGATVVLIVRRRRLS